MKTRRLVVFAMASLILGCNLDEVQTWGDMCPGIGNPEFEGIPLSYIGTPDCNADNMQACDTSLMANKNISIYFETKNCPPEFKNCMTKDGDDGETVYYCERDEKTVCSKGQMLCTNEDGEDFCIDPSSNESCGAYDCNAEPPTYGGKRCNVKESACTKIADNSYACESLNGLLLCDITIDPSSAHYCGAKNCISEENYGGDDCSLYEDERLCTKDEENGTYRCACRGDDILCDGRCVRPESDGEFCGAKGACSSDDPEDENFKGINCSQGEARCWGGKCKCYNDNIWCVVDELNDGAPHCYSPADNATCNARLAEDEVHCDVSPCGSSYACTDVSFDAYQCELKDCEDGEQLCSDGDEKKCYPKNDIHHCGSCYKDCDEHNYQNVAPYDCLYREDEDKYYCAYECIDGLVNCGQPNVPDCINLSATKQHCGSCEIACSDNQYCSGGKCIDTICSENECTSSDTNGSVVCLNSDSQCGPNCAVCKNIHDNGYCVNGVCLIRSCLENEHPVYNDDAQIEKCEKNTNESCAPVTMKTSESPVNCTKTLTEHVKATGCSVEGICVVLECEDNFHISADRTKCIANDPKVCGSPTSPTTTDCSAIEHAETTICNANGTCTVTKCAAGFHLSNDKKKCEANVDTSCGGQTTIGTNCATIANIANASAGKCDAATGKCVVSQCAATFHLNSGKNGCDANSAALCAAVNSSSTMDCTKIANIASASAVACNASGTCTVSQCAATFHLNSGKNACIPNSNVLCAPVNSNEAVDCSKIANSAGTSCNSSGNCTVSQCSIGFHLNSSKTGCVQNSNTSCGATNSNSVTNCTTIANIASTSAGTCTASGSCTVSQCAAGYHLNSSKTGCDKNSDTSCGATNSNSVTNCTTIANIASTSAGTCTSGGACTVSQCAAGYHLNSGKTGCDKNSDSACAATNSSSVTNCQTIANIAGSSYGTCNSSGSCVVSKCKSGYHIKSGKTACEENSNTACGSTTSTPKNCQNNSYEKVCNTSKGYCSCSANDSTVLNYDGNACVTKWCKGIPGVKSGSHQTGNYYGGSDSGCLPTECLPGYKLEHQGVGAICRPVTANDNGKCTSLGYKNAKNSSGMCLGCASGWNNCSSDQCSSNAKYYISGCLPLDACCGRKDVSLTNAEYYMCTNCLAIGSTCNVSTGTCK